MVDRVVNEDFIFDKVYRMINENATSNALLQGVSGMIGFPVNLAVDAVVVFKLYKPMINDIRQLYGRTVLTENDLIPVLSGLVKEILTDLVVDKVLGSVPVAGAYFNAISAKALTWRLGMLVAILSSRGEEFTKQNLMNVSRLVRNLNPQADMLKFAKPDYESFKKVVVSVSDNEMNVFESKIQAALSVF